MSQALPDVCEHMFGRPPSIAIGFVCVEPPIQLGTLPASQRQSLLVRRDAVPEIFHELHALLDG
jgi:hypothetical protein